MCLHIYLLLSELQTAPHGQVKEDHHDSLKLLVLHLPNSSVLSVASWTPNDR
jgi:hypothetical protein